jgi:predicted metalloprotease with PDZ domain
MSSLASGPNITYHVHMDNPHMHYFQMEVVVTNSKSKETEWFMPVWTPGSYLVREFSKNIDRVTATDQEGNPLEVIKMTKNTWKVKNQKKDYTLKYRVYAFEESVRTSYLDDQHAQFMPTSACLYPVDMDIPVTLQFYPPAGWEKITTPMAEGNTPWIRHCGGMDELFDSPVEMGNQFIFPFMAAGKPHELVMVGQGNYHADSLVQELIKVVEKQTEVFQENPTGPYYFIVNNTQQRGGGLEHMNATCIQFPRDAYSGRGWIGLMSLLSHEYFHIWNAKRLRPAGLGPFDYSAENYTTSLWIGEGLTSYYDDLIMLRSGIITKEDYWLTLQGILNSVVNNYGDAYQSLAESSFDAWIKAYRRSENSNNTEVSYYTKGALMGMLLDMLIIGNSNAQYSLDDAMRKAWKDFYKSGNKGYTEEDFKKILEFYAGENLDWFYNQYIFGNAPIDYAFFLDKVGMQAVHVGGSDAKPYLGVSMGTGNVISSLREDSPAAKAGLNAFDQVLAINGVGIVTTVDKELEKYRIGDQIDITVNRRGLTRTFKVKLGSNPNMNLQLTPLENPTEDQVRNYKKWMHIAH